MSVSKKTYGQLRVTDSDQHILHCGWACADDLPRHTGADDLPRHTGADDLPRHTGADDLPRHRPD
jgi:hypothetical protein